MQINGHSVSAGWVRFTGQLIITLFIAAGVYFKLDNRVANNQESIKNQHDWITRIDLDRQHILTATAVADQLAATNSARISQLEISMRDLGPKVDKIDANVLWLMSRLKEK
jgi:hypothetical protein